MTNKNKNMENEILQDWVFHYNPYIKLWAGIHRDLYQHYWTNINHSDIIFHTNLESIKKLVVKYKGDIKKIKAKLNAK
jgi:hypothetical protein